MGNSIPYAWYITRSSALVAFFLLYSSIFLGLAIQTPFFRKIINPAHSFRIHCWISLQALVFAAIHGITLLFDDTISFRLEDIFIPFASPFSPNLVALGIVGFYAMIILTVTSYFKEYISHRLWRITHSLNIILYLAILVHALFLGTDMKITIVRNAFILFNVFLTLFMLYNLIWRSANYFKNKKNNENLR